MGAGGGVGRLRAVLLITFDGDIVLGFQHLLDIFVILFSSADVILLHNILDIFADYKPDIYVKFIVLKQLLFLLINTLLVIEMFHVIFLGCCFVDGGNSECLEIVDAGSVLEIVLRLLLFAEQVY